MAVMARCVVLSWQVALRADGVARQPQPSRMRFVAIAARHAFRVHPALEEGRVGVDLVTLLPVVMKQARLEQARPETVFKSTE